MVLDSSILWKRLKHLSEAFSMSLRDSVKDGPGTLSQHYRTIPNAVLEVFSLATLSPDYDLFTYFTLHAVSHAKTRVKVALWRLSCACTFIRYKQAVCRRADWVINRCYAKTSGLRFTECSGGLRGSFPWEALARSVWMSITIQG